jgi:hypothetical protein
MSERNSRPIEEEVKRLFKSNNGKISNNDFFSLRQKYQDVDIVEKIQQLYLEKYERVSRKAKKFAQLIRDKYNNNQYPFHTLLEKAKQYKQKHNLTDEEFAEFQRIYEQELIEKKSSEVIVPFNNMSKVLGNVNVEIHSQAKFNDSDLKHLQEIIKLHSSSKTLHAQVQIQSFQYEDMSLNVLESDFNRNLGVSPSDHIHPVLAALFIPKFPEIDKFLLQANLSAIIKVRFNNLPFVTRADYELFYALTNDPNDVICDSSSPMLDLLNRAQLQNSLWNSVLNLRSGNFYNILFRQFISSVDMCKRNKYDNPELLYGRSDTIILKRLLSSFSFRPTYIATTPAFHGESIVNPFNQQLRPVVTSIPMYNLKLPFNIPAQDDDEPIISLNDAFSQKQYFIENNKLIIKSTNLIWSKGVIIINVDRTSVYMNFKPNAQPYRIDAFPKSVGGKFELDTRKIDCKTSYNVNKVVMRLKSVVFTNYDNEMKIVLGSSAMMLKQVDAEPECYLYDPISVNTKDTDGSWKKPCRQIPYSYSEEEDNFEYLAGTLGTIFIYECDGDEKEY